MVYQMHIEDKICFSNNRDSLFLKCNDTQRRVSMLEFHRKNDSLVILGYPKYQMDKIDNLDDKESRFSYRLNRNGSADVLFDDLYVRNIWDRIKPSEHYIGVRIFKEILNEDYTDYSGIKSLAISQVVDFIEEKRRKIEAFLEAQNSGHQLWNLMNDDYDTVIRWKIVSIYAVRLIEKINNYSLILERR